MIKTKNITKIEKQLTELIEESIGKSLNAKTTDNVAAKFNALPLIERSEALLNLPTTRRNYSKVTSKDINKNTLRDMKITSPWIAEFIESNHKGKNGKGYGETWEAMQNQTELNAMRGKYNPRQMFEPDINLYLKGETEITPKFGSYLDIGTAGIRPLNGVKPQLIEGRPNRVGYISNIPETSYKYGSLNDKNFQFDFKDHEALLATLPNQQARLYGQKLINEAKELQKDLIKVPTFSTVLPLNPHSELDLKRMKYLELQRQISKFFDGISQKYTLPFLNVDAMVSAPAVSKIYALQSDLGISSILPGKGLGSLFGFHYIDPNGAIGRNWTPSEEVIRKLNVVHPRALFNTNSLNQLKSIKAIENATGSGVLQRIKAGQLAPLNPTIIGRNPALMITKMGEEFHYKHGGKLNADNYKKQTLFNRKSQKGIS